MKEVMAIIRQNKINQTKNAMIEAGFPAATAVRALGRGRRPVEPELLEAINRNPRDSAEVLPTLAQGGRLYPKRLVLMIVPDNRVSDLVSALIKANQTGSPGDGKIFVSPVFDTIRVRTGEQGQDAIDEMNGSGGKS
ncbi:MAG: P-II family nitrogen regulator [Deltaproteobacteria bacterium]